MQSNLKKSLYLGLAALSFASVASATNASSANAAKKHSHKRVAKKVTYKTTNRNLDQSVVFQSTGKNAVYSRPGTVKGAKVVATKTDMGSKANSNKSSDYFMAYQEATTSKGVHYYKVVSFDKKVRGYVYVGGVNKTQGATDTSAKYNFKDAHVYLKNNRLFNNAYGTVFGAKRVNVNPANVGDKFSVDKAVTNREGWTYFHVTDSNPSVGNLVSGWVNSDNLVNNSADALQNTTDRIKVNFVDASTGNLVKSGLLPKNIGYNNGDYDAKQNASDSQNDVFNVYGVQSAMNAYTNDNHDTTNPNPLLGTGYTYSNDANSNGFYANMSAMTNLKKGSTVTIKVNKLANDKQVKVNFKSISTDGKTTNNIDGVKSNEFDLTNSGLVGNDNTFFNLSNVENNLFNGGKALNVVKDKDGKSYVFSAKYTNTNNSNGSLFNVDNSMKNNVLFGDVKDQNSNNAITVYYTPADSSVLVPAAGTTTSTDQTSSASGVANTTTDDSGKGNQDSGGTSQKDASESEIKDLANGVIDEYNDSVKSHGDYFTNSDSSKAAVEAHKGDVKNLVANAMKDKLNKTNNTNNVTFDQLKNALTKKGNFANGQTSAIKATTTAFDTAVQSVQSSDMN